MAIAYDYGAGVTVMGQHGATNSDNDDDDDDKKAFSSEGEYGRRSFYGGTYVCVWDISIRLTDIIHW